MKRYISYIMALFVALVVTENVWGETKISGSFGGGSLFGTYILTGNVTLNGVITIDDDKTLTIKTDGTTRKITAGKALTRMFKVEHGGTLNIQGTSENDRIIIDGSAKFEWNADDNKLTKTGGYSLEKEAIWNQGTLKMSYTTIQNVHISTDNDSGGGLYINGECDKPETTNRDEGKENGTTTLTNCSIQNCVSRHGAALHIAKQDSKKNTAEKCKVTLKNTTIQKCYADHPKKEGGVIRTNGGAVSNLELINCTIKNNRSDWSGGGLYWNAAGTADTKCTINGCLFENNIAGERGGAMMLETTFEFVKNRTTIQNNKVENGKGGGIVITGYCGGGLTVQSKYELTFDLTDKLYLKNNQANDGGGIAFSFSQYDLNDDFTANNKPETKLTTRINLNGAQFESNKAINGAGGAIHLWNNIPNWTDNKRTIEYVFNMNSGILKNNTATTDGGAVYTYLAGITHNKTDVKLEIKENYAVDKGGAIYVEGGKVELGNVEMIGNGKKDSEITKNGGAICIENGAFSMAANSKIQNNAARIFGGGLYIFNTDNKVTDPEKYPKVSCAGGTFKENKAAIGGGACVDGKIKLELASTFDGNEAKNGGGIYIMNGAIMEFGAGLVKNNIATHSYDSSMPTTAWKATTNSSGKTLLQGSSTEVYGLGGGIYMDSNTTLTFTEPNSLGIYGNSAIMGGDDIFANGLSTNVTLPRVKDMVLNGYDVIGNELYWVEDYPDNDENYSNGTKILGGDKLGIRYDKVLRNKKLDVGKLDNTTQHEISNYLCMRTGYDLVFVTLTKKGLKSGDNATFSVYYSDKDDNPQLYCKLIMTGNGGDIVKTIALPSGYWKFEESTWGGKYNPTPTFSPAHHTGETNKNNGVVKDYIHITRGDNKGYDAITITNTLKSISVLEFEHRVVNRMKKTSNKM